MATRIATSRSDVIWNYIGTIVSMASGFVLLPLLMGFLSDEELGLWYVYVAIANLALLFEFGFNPTFARNIVYVVSGARKLTAEGCDTESVQDGIDFHLLNVVIRTAKLVYATIALVVLVGMLIIGSAYVAYLTAGMDPTTIWVSWALFCVAVFLNLYFLYTITVLRGYGDVAGENKAKTFSRISQLVVSAVLLFAGFGLIGAAIGYLVNAALLRLIAVWRLRKHADIESGRKADSESISREELRDVLLTVKHVAWRDGVVQLALYASTQATSIMSSLYLGLAETGTYSVLLQLATAVYNFATAYPRSFYPTMQASVADDNTEKQKEIVSSGIVAYWFLILVGTVGVCVVILPLLPLFKPNVNLDYVLFLALVAYLSLLNQHSIFCNYIISMNEIPYMAGYLVAALLGIGLVFVFCGVLGFGVWGIVLGQAISQLVYNNWRWPSYLCGKLGISYSGMLPEGVAWWRAKLARLIGASKA